jgi:hypothetical protein
VRVNLTRVVTIWSAGVGVTPYVLQAGAELLCLVTCGRGWVSFWYTVGFGVGRLLSRQSATVLRACFV